MKKLYLISSLSVLSLSAISAVPQKRKNINLNNEICEYITVNGAQVKVCVSGIPASSQILRQDLGLIQLKAKNLIKKQAAKNNSAKARENFTPLPESTVTELTDLESDYPGTETESNDPSSPDVSSYDPSSPDVSSYDPSSPDVSSYDPSSPALTPPPSFTLLTNPGTAYPLKFF